MAASTVYLQELAETVPTCLQTATVEEVAAQFCETAAQRLVLTDRQNQAIGLIELPKLLPYLLSGRDRALPVAQLQPPVIEPLFDSEIKPSPDPIAAMAIPPEAITAKATQVQVNQLKDDFLACITHELRTPLTAILGLSTLLKDQSIGELNDRQLRYAQQIYRSGRHLIGIVNDMLDLTRVETEQFELDLEPVGISVVCLDAFEEAQKLYLAEHTSLRSSASAPEQRETTLPTFNLEIEPGLLMLTADEKRLRQMLINLLSNALKFTQTSGNIGLRVNRWEGWIAFTVWDTGIGIPPEKQHLIFQKFQQLESSMTRQFEGTGLGLVLAQRLARLHGGDISFTSQENRGSQFTLLLPPEPPQAVTQTIAAPKKSDELEITNSYGSSQVSSRLVLVVEAGQRNMEDVTEHLSELGYRSVIARSGVEALEKARQLQPCAIFLNPHLPHLSGWDVLTLLKARPETAEIPVIVTAALLEQTLAYELGADSFLRLPIVHTALRETLQHLTQQTTGVIESPSKHDRYIVLCLSPTAVDENGAWSIELSHLLHRHNFRVIESSDVEQAELLARVWKAQVVVLNAPVPEPLQFLTQLSEQAYLSALPLVTLDAMTTQVANQIPNLAVFPCLANWVHQVPLGLSDSLAEQLLQAIEIAVNFAGRPFVLATDLATWTAQAPADRSDWLQAFIQYVQAAGLRGTVGKNREDILQTLQSQSVSLMLLYWHDNTNVLQRALKILQELEPRPPMLLIDHHHSARSIGSVLKKSLADLNIAVMAPTASMDDLLRHVRHLLGVAG
jgi:signal transduction histidine kinase/ActR/RegA family two-component response regulator